MLVAQLTNVLTARASSGVIAASLKSSITLKILSYKSLRPLCEVFLWETTTLLVWFVVAFGPCFFCHWVNVYTFVLNSLATTALASPIVTPFFLSVSILSIDFIWVALLTYVIITLTFVCFVD